MHHHVTLLRPDGRGPEARGISWTLPPDLLGQSAARLRILALLYALAFFLAGLFPMLLVPADRALLFGSFLQWGPMVIAIAVALLVAAVIRSARVSLPAVMNIGLAFEVAGSYGIAAAEFANPIGLDLRGRVLGLSWVAVWTVLFTIVVPTPPRRAVAAALASVSSVPVIVGLMIATGTTSFRPDPGQFFFWLVFPYLIVVGMAYVGSRVVYSLGTEVRRARELGSYRLEEKLGQGGMGEVWRARHRMLARPAAIKLIRPAWRTTPARGCRKTPCAGSSAKRSRSPASARPTPWSSSISASRRTAPSITSWSCSTAWTPTRSCGGTGPPRPTGSSTSSTRSATRCPRRSSAVWFTATSSPRTSSSAGTVRSTIS
jgi:hypothetical protein